MLSTVRSRPFLVGFFLGLLFILGANIYTYDDGAGVFGKENAPQMVECFDCVKRFGWPFRLHQSGTIMHMDQILWMGLGADLFVALCASTMVGAFTYLSSQRKTGVGTKRRGDDSEANHPQ